MYACVHVTIIYSKLYFTAGFIHGYMASLVQCLRLEVSDFSVLNVLKMLTPHEVKAQPRSQYKQIAADYSYSYIAIVVVILYSYSYRCHAIKA